MADKKTSWIGVSQYKTAKQYPPKEKEICKFTCVMPFKDEIHTGIKTHRCSSEKGHEGDCLCKCGFAFKGWGSSYTSNK